MFERWTRAVVRHRIIVISAWLLFTILGLVAGSKLSAHLTTSFTVPSSESAKADRILADHFSENIEGSFTVVYRFGSVSDSQIEVLKGKIATAVSDLPSAKITQQRAVGGVLFANVATSFKLLDAAAYTEKLRRSLADQGLPAALVTGPPAIDHDVSPILASDLKRGEFLAVLLAFLLLILALGTCWGVVVPFVFGAATISLTLAAIYLLAQRFLMVLYIPNIVELIGLGLAIDYSLLIVHRFRREMMESDEFGIEDAIVKTMETAGRTVMLSGLSVSIGLATLLLVPVPTVRSLGAAGLVVPVISILAALTLQPVLLSFLGRRGVTPKGFAGMMAKSDSLQGMMARIARFVIRKPIPVLLASLAALTVGALSIVWLQLTPNSLSAIPGGLESARGLRLVTAYAGPGLITPNEIVIDLGSASLAATPTVKAARIALAQKILENHEVSIVATGEKAPYVDDTGRFLRMFVVGRHDFGAEASKKLVRELRQDYFANAGFPRDTKIYLGGAPAQGVDLLNSLRRSFPWVALLVFVMTYLVLLRAFRSIILPLKAILLDWISVVVAYGLLVLVFRFGVGSSVLGTYQLDQIEAWVPIFLFAVLFGMSMDYEVFIVSRIREARKRGSRNNQEIVAGLAYTGGVVSAAAIILIGALGGLIFGHFAGLQELGVGLALGVLIDATIVRGLLLPSAMVLLGRWNWWLPGSVARVIRTTASPLEEREARL